MSAALLERAQEGRRTRGDEGTLLAVGAMVDELCDSVELDVNVPNYTLVGPDARKKLAGLISYYRKSDHPFTQCVRDNRKRFGAKVNDVCGVMTDLVKGTTHWRKGGKKTATALALSQEGSPSTAPQIDDELFSLLSAISQIDYEYAIGAVQLEQGVDLEHASEECGTELAIVSAKDRSKLPDLDFALPKKRKYIIKDKLHAILALGRSKDTPEQSEVKAAVCKRYSTLPACQPAKTPS